MTKELTKYFQSIVSIVTEPFEPKKSVLALYFNIAKPLLS